MRILFTSTGGAGHLQPLLPYAAEMTRRGHQVSFAAPASVAAVLDMAGLDHHVLTVAAPEIMRPIIARMDAAQGEAIFSVAIREVFFGPPAQVILPQMLELVETEKPDLIIHEASEPCGAVAGSALGVPVQRIDVHNPEVEARFLDLGAAPIDHLRSLAGLKPDGGEAFRATPVFTAFPESLDGTRLRLAPFRVRTDAPKPARADLPPLIYITFGTLAGRLPASQAAYRTALAAVADLPVRALLTLGPVMPRDELGPVPANVTVETFVPQAEVLARASAVLCHGGTGTTLGTLAAGLPLVITPLFADQPANGQSVAATGAGLSLRDPSVAALREAVQTVLATPAFGKRAKAIAAEIAGLPGIAAAVDRMTAFAG